MLQHLKFVPTQDSQFDAAASALVAYFPDPTVLQLPKTGGSQTHRLQGMTERQNKGLKVNHSNYLASAMLQRWDADEESEQEQCCWRYDASSSSCPSLHV